jgi:LuxR family transcriptional regulator, maltose regulon positive regulatory protein
VTMATKRPQLAKLTRPRLHKAVARERLFELLDEKREYPVVWIVGPPGAGKTTLAASYLEEAGAPAVWYQIDPGDSDPATFFFYLKQAIESAARRKGKPLPLLTPEYLPDLPGFARRFLRDGFSRLPEDAILVFDNYHDIASDSALHVPFKAALAEVPPGSNVIVLSRTDPPPAFADAIVNQTISSVTWEELRLTPEETTAIGASRDITDKALLSTLHEQSTGWMAGVTLMLEHLRGGKGLEALAQGEARDTVFNYFAGLIFDNATEEMRDVLMKTAFLPRVSAGLAEAVTGNSKAIERIEELYRRHLFTDRVAEAEFSYQFHALFRAFLKSRAAIAYSVESRREIARRAAASLAAGGHVEQAFELYGEAQNWDEAERLLISTAANLIGQGRWKTLEQWVESLPPNRLDANPWVRYWLGRSKNLVSPASARPVIEAAYRTFRETGDEVGQILCATTMLEGYYFEYENFRPMDPWIELVATLLTRGVGPLSKENELRVTSVLIIGAALRASRLSIHEFCLNRVTELLKDSFDTNTKITAACMLHEYAAVAMDFEVIQRATEIARPLLDSPDLSAPCAMLYFQAEAYTHYLQGRYDRALAGYDAAASIARENAFQNGISSLVEYQRGLCERRMGLLDRAEKTILQIENRSLPARDYLKGGLNILKAFVAFDRGNMTRAIDAVRIAYRYHEALGDFGGTVWVGAHAANMAIAGNRFSIARDYLGQLRRVEYGAVAENYLGVVALNEAWMAHRMGDTASRDKMLGEVLVRARDEGTRVRLRWHTNALAELLPITISSGIESDTARALAREFVVVPEPRDVEDWPWPLKVYTLGRFELLVEGQSPDYSRKVPKKVLALLKTIIAFGAIDVPCQKLLDALWPDQEGDAANRSFTATLHRLRKLLGNSLGIHQAGGEISLERKSCWVDSLAFEERLQRAADNDEQMGHAVALYRGAFLAQEENVPWAAPTRERLRAKFIQAIGKLGKSLEGADRHESAIELYLRGIEADSLVEPFYQGLMRCYDKLNRRMEAVSAYRRLRETLSITLGVPPSSASQRLFETLRLN